MGGKLEEDFDGGKDRIEEVLLLTTFELDFMEKGAREGYSRSAESVVCGFVCIREIVSEMRSNRARKLTRSDSSSEPERVALMLYLFVIDCNTLELEEAIRGVNSEEHGERVVKVCNDRIEPGV